MIEESRAYSSQDTSKLGVVFLLTGQESLAQGIALADAVIRFFKFYQEFSPTKNLYQDSNHGLLLD